MFAGIAVSGNHDSENESTDNEFTGDEVVAVDFVALASVKLPRDHHSATNKIKADTADAPGFSPNGLNASYAGPTALISVWLLSYR